MGKIQIPQSGVQTRLVHHGIERSQFTETCEGMFLTSGFVYDNAQQAQDTFDEKIERHQYTRFSNPTNTMLEERLADLEGAEACFTTATGMAAVHGALSGIVKVGDRIVASRAMFGSCLQIISNILPRFGVEYELVDGHDLDAWQRAFSKPAQAVFIETPANPMLTLVDLEIVCNMAHQAGALVVVDNILATPMGQRPLQLGADIVVYSATKHMDGQGRVMGGAILGSKELLNGDIRHFLRNTGPSLSPFNAWLLLKSLETMPLRLQYQCASSLQIAKVLQAHPQVSQVCYPFLPEHPQYELARRQMTMGGSVITVDIKGDKQRCFAVMDKLRLFAISNNFGDSKSLITHPATTTHRSVPLEDKQHLGISDSTIRLSIGLEDTQDLIADLHQALEG